MTLSVTHTFVSGFADDPKQAAAGEVLPSHWNATHTVSGSPFPTAGSNLTFYVATTGSDSNDGLSVSTPFATIQHALDIAGSFDYGSTHIPTINVAAGTYTISSPLSLPELINARTNFAVGFIEGAGQATTTISDPAGLGIWVANGNRSIWSINGFKTDGSGEHYTARNLATIHLDQDPSHITLTDSTLGVNFGYLFNTVTGGTLVADFATITISHNTFRCLLQTGLQQPVSSFFGTNITIPGGSYGAANSFIIDGQGSRTAGSANIQHINWTVTNFASFVGARYQGGGTGDVIITTANATLNDVPGVASLDIVDNNTFVQGNPGTGLSIGAFALPIAGPPTTANNIAEAQSFQVSKDTTNNPRMLVFNDAGSIYVKQIGRFVNTQTSTAYTMALFDQDGRVEMNNAGANDFNVPQDSSFSPAAPPVGTEVRVVQTGAGATTIRAGAGATVNGSAAVGGQYKSVLLYKTSANTWNQTNI